jgi:hypothetical protein
VTDDDNDDDLHIRVLVMWESHNERSNQQVYTCVCLIVRKGLYCHELSPGAYNRVLFFSVEMSRCVVA